MASFIMAGLLAFTGLQTPAADAEIAAMLACSGNTHIEAETPEEPLVRRAETLDVNDVMLGFADWIAAETDYEVRSLYSAPPEISLCGVGETITYEGDNIIVEPGLRAAYDLGAEKIFLVQPWNIADAYDRSVLLHEVIHSVQLANRGWPCLQAPEWEAYKLQDLWLAQRGIAAEFDYLQIYFLSRCPRDHHP